MKNDIQNIDVNVDKKHLEEIIIVKNLNFKYDKEYIFENLNFTVNKGDFLGIIGANGTGKSTLIKLILGQLKPESGSIEVFGKKIASCKELDKIGYVPQVGQSRDSNFPATVSEIVQLNLYKEIGMFKFAKKIHKEKVKKALELVEMQDFSSRKFSDLSGGQQQRVIIAKSIVNNPDVLVLDEPTTGIDHKSEHALYRLLDKLNRENKITIIMISHDLDKIKLHSNKIVDLSKDCCKEDV